MSPRAANPRDQPGLCGHAIPAGFRERPRRSGPRPGHPHATRRHPPDCGPRRRSGPTPVRGKHVEPTRQRSLAGMRGKDTFNEHLTWSHRLWMQQPHESRTRGELPIDAAWTRLAAPSKNRRRPLRRGLGTPILPIRPRQNRRLRARYLGQQCGVVYPGPLSGPPTAPSPSGPSPARRRSCRRATTPADARSGDETTQPPGTASPRGRRLPSRTARCQGSNGALLPKRTPVRRKTAMRGQ